MTHRTSSKMHRTRRWHLGFLALFSLFAGSACASSGVRYGGVYADPVTVPERVRTSAYAGSDTSLLGHVQASCELEEQSLEEGALLGDLLCSESMLRSALLDTAAYVGGTDLVQVECSSDEEEATCGGIVFRQDEPTELAAGSDQLARSRRALDPWSVEVHLVEQQADRVRLAIRSKEQVATVPRLPASDRKLGEVVAHCHEECSDDVLRHAVQVGAAYAGARHVGYAACHDEEHGRVCRSWAGAYEVDLSPAQGASDSQAARQE